MNMLPQLLLSKRLFLEGSQFSRRADAVSCGLAISLFQDAAEMYIWALVKARGITVKESFTFTGNLDALEKAGIKIPDRPKLLELNKARIGFKHFGNLPAPDEARKFRTYTEDFLTTATREHFSLDFENISLVDLVAFEDVRERLKIAESQITAGKIGDASRELAISKVLLFRYLDRQIPKVDQNLKDVGKGFQYVSQYLGVLREISIVTLLQVPITDYTFLRTHLMHANQFGNGDWQTVDTGLIKPSDETCRRIISILVEMSIRISSIL